MISQILQIDKKQAESIRILVSYYQPVLKSDDLEIKAMFWVLKYKVKILDEEVGEVIVQGIVYYDFTAHDLYFTIEHQLYYY